MRMEHFDDETANLHGRLLDRGPWWRLGMKVACAGACTLMAGQMFLPSVMRAAELEGLSARAQDAAMAADVEPGTAAAVGADAAAGMKAETAVGAESETAVAAGPETASVPSVPALSIAEVQTVQDGASDASVAFEVKDSGATGDRSASSAAASSTGDAQSCGAACVQDQRADQMIRKTNIDVETAIIENAKLAYVPGEAPRASATVAAIDADKYEIAYECWEEMGGDDPRNPDPVAFWYSDSGKYTSGMKRITQFEEGKSYMYSVALRLKGESAFAFDCDATINGRPVSMVLKTVDGLFLPNAASMYCERPIDEERAIDVVEITGATTAFNAGDKPVFTAGTPVGSSSIFQCEFWMGDDGSDVNSQKFWDENITNHIDAFKSGVTYRYGVYLKAARGFYFTANTKLMVNGQLVGYHRDPDDMELDNPEKMTTLWAYTDLTMRPEAVASAKPNDTHTDAAEGAGGKIAATKTTAATNATDKVAAKKATADLPKTGDDAMLAMAALGVTGATVVAAGVAVHQRRG